VNFVPFVFSPASVISVLHFVVDARRTCLQEGHVKSFPRSAIFSIAFLAATTGCKPASPGDPHALQDESGKSEGGFRATKACPAYQSKNKQTNPGNIQITAGQTYEFIQFNRPGNPDWAQIRIPNASPEERWVAMTCGEAPQADSEESDEESSESADNEEEEGDSGNTCRLAGGADDHTFALSWQPAFCELKSGKKECQIRDPGVYQASNFTLHGLWPNKDACHTNFGFCKGEKKSVDFCQYDPVPISSKLKRELAEVMPSVSSGTCLERYEWYKHGLCQTQWDAEEYFSISVRLTKEFNRAAATVMAESVGDSVKEADFFAAIDSAFGPNAHKRLQLKCQKGDLVDVYIKLPRQIGKDASLRDLIQKAKPAFRSNCGGKFQVDEIDD
jgi:ribonuclease T2